MKARIYCMLLLLATAARSAESRQHTSRVQNDYIEQQSEGERLNSVGGAMK